MRITGNRSAGQLLSHLNLLGARQGRLQNQVVTGLRIAAPGDDPWAFGATLGLQNNSARLSQFVQNIATLEQRASMGQSSIQALKTIIDRASEIATQVDGPRSAEDMKMLAIEIDQLLERALQMGNRKEAGRYLFCGTAGGEAPFQAARDTDGRITSVAYHGNVSVAQAQIDENVWVSADAVGGNTGDNGTRGVFLNSSTGADLFGHLVALRDHLNAGDGASVVGVDRDALLNDEQNVIFHAASYGVLTARLEATESMIRLRDEGLQSAILETAGADASETIVSLTQTQNAYQAALQSGARLLQLQQSLLDYLR